MSSRRGFVLIPCLLGLVLAGAVLALLTLQLHSAIRRAAASSAQLRALTMAHSGIEQSRRLLATHGPESLLKGPDGRLAPEPVSRDPIEFSQALSLEWPALRDYFPAIDDGWPPLATPWTGSDSGLYLLRFSNDWYEGGRLDADGLVVVRSTGVVRSPPAVSGAANHAAVVEAALRREQGLLLDSAIVAAGHLDLRLDEGTSVRGGRTHAVTLLRRQEEPRFSVTPAGAESRISGVDSSPPWSIRSPAPGSAQERLVGPGFWASFLTRLSHFSTAPPQPPPAAGLFALETMAAAGLWKGVVVTRGEAHLPPGFRLEGLVIHLGPGLLHLSGAEIEGGVWVASVDSAVPSELSLDSSSRIRWDEPALQAAVARLPISLVAWRLVFPGG